MAITTFVDRPRAPGILMVLALALLLVPLSAVNGQTASPSQVQPRPAATETAPPGGTDRLTTTDRQITIDVQVTDKAGKPVRGMQQQDFTVLDDKQPQKLVYFHSADDAGDRSSNPPVESSWSSMPSTLRFDM